MQVSLTYSQISLTCLSDVRPAHHQGHQTRNPGNKIKPHKYKTGNHG